jgi:diguanylate cyclase (GGDEF)-like protein/PAS domain S-box-containing protein
MAIIAVLFAFMVVSDFIIYQQHKKTIYQEFSESKQEQLRLVTMASKEAIEQRDYVEVERLLAEWGKQIECIVDVRLVTTDGVKLAGYYRGTPARESRSFQSQNELDDMKFVLRVDMQELMDEDQKMSTGIVVISALIALIIALIISAVMRKLTIAPMNNLLDKRKEMLIKMMRISKENKRLVESAGEGIFSLRSDGICTFINETALALLGFERDEAIGKDLHSLIHYADPDGSSCAESDCQINFTLKTAKGVIVDEDKFWRSDGTSFPVSYSSFPLEEGNTHLGAVVVFRDITEQYKQRALLEHQATHDPLTALVNRREFERRLSRAGETARDDQKEHILLYMDLDNFKQVNDNAGHNAGDELLRRVAKNLSNLMRDRDTLARYGGDEFVVLLENCSMAAAMRVASGIISTLCTEEFTWDGISFAVGVSIGVVEVNSNCFEPDAVLNAADTACYMAKQLGGCQIQAYSSGLVMGNKMH